MMPPDTAGAGPDASDRDDGHPLDAMSQDFITYLHELFADFGPIRTRAMFGGHGVYAAIDGADDRIIGVVIDDALYLKADAETADRFRQAGCTPFVYRAKGREIPMSYWSLPGEAMDSAQAMLPWARLAWDAASRRPVRKRCNPRRRATHVKPGTG